jgi:hypothetical protein
VHNKPRSEGDGAGDRSGDAMELKAKTGDRLTL